MPHQAIHARFCPAIRLGARDAEAGPLPEGTLVAPKRAIRSVPKDPQAMPVHRVRKAYEQVNDQLRELIVSGELAPGERLPNEAVLAREFGVSRATVREALRILTAQNLIRTTKGAGGGSYVTLPTVDHISEFLRGNLNLLSESEHVTLEEFLELRELIEVPAARLAAEPRKPGRRQAPPRLDPRASRCACRRRSSSRYNKGFHTVVVEACGNTLLYIAAQPVFTVLQTHLARSPLGQELSPLDQRAPPRESWRRSQRGRRRRRRADARAPGVPAPRLRAGLAARRHHAAAGVTPPARRRPCPRHRAVRRRARGGRSSSPTSAPR